MTGGVVACVGDPWKQETFGGTPFFLLDAGIRSGVFSGAIDISKHNLPVTFKLSWHLGHLLRFRSWRGRQFADAFLTGSDLKRHDYSPTFVLNLFQLYPASLASNNYIDRWYYIDQTLSQLFYDYGLVRDVGQDYALATIERESRQYQSSAGIIVTSRWARESLIRDYHVEPDLIWVVPRGANLPPVTTFRRATEESDSDRHRLRLVFVGKEWHRKGLDRLIEAMVVCRSRGVSVTLEVIGTSKSDVPRRLASIDGIVWHGMISKHDGGSRYLEILTRSDVGCLLSRIEAGGISLREFHYAGLATIAPLTGGARDFAVEGATTLVPPSASNDEIADVIYQLATDRELLAKQRATSAAAKHTLTWAYAASLIQAAVSNERLFPSSRKTI